MKAVLDSPMTGIAIAMVLFFAGLQFGRTEAARPRFDGDVLDVDGGLLVRRSLETLETLDGLEVELRQEIDLYATHVIGDGRYLQRGAGGEQTRIDMVYSAGGEKVADVQQIDNGRFLLTRYRTPTRSELTRVDLEYARAELGYDPVALDPGHFGPGAGLLALVRSFGHEFEFSPPRQESWQGQTVWFVTGHWKRERLKARFGIEAGEGEGDRLSERVPLPLPTHIELVIGSDPQLPFFPYRIDFLRRDSSGDRPMTSRIGRLEMHQIRHRIVPAEIDFQPTPTEEVVSDETAAFVARHKDSETVRR
ncbi:MAG TPA: hypothetical protein DCQ98_18570 [Planctomycetaceae bacterium]|nr:hypothetical protein [Planctomycetaceae bacterium]HRF00138.1 hypothetical protein [Pirellulaceae bacterium]